MRYPDWQPHPQPNQGVPATPPLQPNQRVPGAPTAQSKSASNPTPQPDKVEMPPDLMEHDIPEDILHFLDVPEEVISDFEAWGPGVLDYPWWHDNVCIFWTLLNNAYKNNYLLQF